MSATYGTTTVRVTMETAKTLRQLSELSKLSIQDIIADWAEACQKILDRAGACNRITLLSSELVTKKGNPTDVVGTFVSPVYAGSFKFTENLSNRAKEFLEKELVEADIQKKRGLKAK